MHRKSTRGRDRIGRAERTDAHGGGTQMAGQGREERHAQMARAGHGQGQTGQETAWQGRVGNSRTSVRHRVVQCIKIELYYNNIVYTTIHPTVLESRGVQRRID
jgi:hypothetical protein